VPAELVGISEEEKDAGSEVLFGFEKLKIGPHLSSHRNCKLKCGLNYC